MMLECFVFVEDNSTTNFSFKRFIVGNLHLGIFDPNTKVIRQEIYLCVVTSTTTYKYKISNNVKRLITKELFFGKICIEFYRPPHSVMVRCNNGKLPVFVRLLERLNDETKVYKLRRIPVIPTNLKFISKTKIQTTDSNVKEIIYQIPNISLRNEVLKNTQILHLPNCNVKNLPVQLGLLCWSEINLENNNLCNDDLLWLEELPIRKTLGALNLSKNRITSFPSALVDFYRLYSLNLRDNQIQCIAGRIGSLQSLRILNLSNNNIRYLPASIINMKLNELDLSQNYLTDNIPVRDVPLERKISGTVARLVDLSSTKIDTLFRRQLSNKDCPRQLLQKLRYNSICICNKQSAPSAMNEFYVTLSSIKFSTSFSIHPQKSDKKSDLFLQYHFCACSNGCDSKEFQRLRFPYFRLL